MAPVAALVFFISSIAENGRAPFDLLEAELEIVAGFNVEYSGLKFGFFFVGDFLHAFTIALVFSILFLGGWSWAAGGPYPAAGICLPGDQNLDHVFPGAADPLLAAALSDRSDDGPQLENSGAVIADGFCSDRGGG